MRFRDARGLVPMRERVAGPVALWPCARRARTWGRWSGSPPFVVTGGIEIDGVPLDVLLPGCGVFEQGACVHGSNVYFCSEDSEDQCRDFWCDDWDCRLSGRHDHPRLHLRVPGGPHQQVRCPRAHLRAGAHGTGRGQPLHQAGVGGLREEGSLLLRQRLHGRGGLRRQRRAHAPPRQQLLTRMRKDDVFKCGDGVCQYTESCGTDDDPDDCKDRGPCPAP
jgi:hypothetical protein